MTTLKIISDYFNVTLDVTPELLSQIWDSPETVGGGATPYSTSGGTVWRTESRWGFSRSGDKQWGWVNFHDPRPGRGDVRWTSQAYQTPAQHGYGHPGADGAVIV